MIPFRGLPVLARLPIVVTVDGDRLVEPPQVYTSTTATIGNDADDEAVRPPRRDSARLLAIANRILGEAIR